MAAGQSNQAVGAGSARSTRPLLIRGADLLTMDGTAGELPATDVLVQDGKIAAIGRRLSAAGAEVVEASGMILMPGMHDGHRHLWHAIDTGARVKTDPRNYAGYQKWKMAMMVAMTVEDHHLVALIGGLQAIDSGVTSIIDFPHAHYSLDRAEAAARGLQASGIGGWCAFQLGVSADWAVGDTISLRRADAGRLGRTTEAHWAIAQHLRDAVFSDRDAPLQLALSPISNPVQPMPDVRAAYDRARAMGVGMVDIHVHKPATPAPEGYLGHRGSGIRDFHDAGLLGPDFHISHGTQLDADELALMRDAGAMITSTAMGEIPYIAEGRGAPVFARARAAGVAAGIGVDVVLSLTQDYFEHIRTAYWSLFEEAESRKIAATYTSTDMLDFATALGARSLRLGDVTGSIALGKRADLVLLRTDRIGFAAGGSLADRVVNFAARQDVDSVWLGGVARKRHGRMLGVDWADMKARLAAAQARARRDAATVRFD
jgi:cytosine/adenosine deaminase-related metal-dependent hydrolase